MDEQRAVAGAGAVLMVPEIPFPSFKDMRASWMTALFLGAMAGGVPLRVFGLPGGTVLFWLLVLYVGRSVAEGAKRLQTTDR